VELEFDKPIGAEGVSLFFMAYDSEFQEMTGASIVCAKVKPDYNGSPTTVREEE